MYVSVSLFVDNMKVVNIIIIIIIVVHRASCVRVNLVVLDYIICVRIVVGILVIDMSVTVCLCYSCVSRVVYWLVWMGSQQLVLYTMHIKPSLN